MILADQQCPLKIPLSKSSLEAIISAPDKDSQRRILLDLDWRELPGLLTIQQLPKLQDHPQVSIEHFIGKAFLSLQGMRETHDIEKIVDEIIEALDSDKIRDGLTLMGKYALQFMAQNEIKDGKYLKQDGSWDYDFNRKDIEQKVVRFELCKDTGILLSAGQLRSLSMFKGDLDDHLHIEGMAGSGKTFELNAFLDVLYSKGVDLNRVLILTYTYAQMILLKTRLPAEVKVLTIGWLAKQLIPEDLTRGNYRHFKAKKNNYGISDAEYASKLSVPSIGHLHPNKVVAAAKSTVKKFCLSGDDEIGLNHIPRWTNLAPDCRPAGNQETASPSAYELLSQAIRLWDLLISRPQKELSLAINEYHIIKLVALNNWTNSNTYFQHILIDESHNQTPPISKILESLGAPVTSFGDKYQSLNSNYTERPTTVSRCHIFESMRAGSNLEQVVTPMLAVHPWELQGAFVGDKSKYTELCVYKKAEVPMCGTAIFTKTPWGLFEWAQRLAKQEQKFTLVDDLNNLSKFAQDIIELYNHKTPPRHGLLQQLGSWDHVYDRFKDNVSFRRIERLLSKGYGHDDWHRAMSFITKSNEAQYTLSTIFNSRNSEFNNVYLTQDVMDKAWKADDRELPKVISELYVGATRVKNKLFVPEEMMNWIEEHNSSQSRIMLK